MNQIMTRDQAIEILRRHQGEFERAGVRHLYLFGSVARDESHAQSDVDLFFDYDRGRLGLFALMEVKELASNILGHRADIMTRDSVHPVLRAGIEAEAAQVF
jgi:predicted nucleotidyltransferase